MSRLVISTGRAIGRPSISYGKDVSDESHLPLPPGDYPEPSVIPVFGLKGLMFKEVYDTNENGIVDRADAINWANVEDPPYTFPSSIPLVDGLEDALEGLASSNPRQAFTFEQSIPDNIWIIDHNLGFKPDVALFTTDGVEFEANVMHTTVNQTMVKMNAPFAGYARLT